MEINNFNRMEIAPMLDKTDRAFRRLLRLVNPRLRLWSEMAHAQALLHAPDPAPWLADCDVVQLAGCEPECLAAAAKIAADCGAGEVNLNAGCPSHRVQAGRFGACLMGEPSLAAECLAAMREAAGGRAAVTVKTRIALDDRSCDDGYDRLLAFVLASRCQRVIIHARKARLSISPAANLTRVPLTPEPVARLARENPGLAVVYNGDVRSLRQAADRLAEGFAGVMIGRQAVAEPFMFSDGARSREQVEEEFTAWALASRNPRMALIRALNLHHGQPIAGVYKQKILALANAASCASLG